jgi:hypothetical protein
MSYTKRQLGIRYDAGLIGWDEVKAEIRAANLCEWYAGCTNQAVGTVTHPVIGPVPICSRCAVKHSLTVVTRA